MAKRNASALALIDEISANAKAELASELRPTLSQIVAALNKLEGALGGAGSRRGRPKGKKRAIKSRVGSGRAKAGKRAPRGALEAAIRRALSSGSPLKIVAITDRVHKSQVFRRHDRKNLYSMITQGLSKLAGVRKTAKGYVLGGGANRGRKKTVKKKAARKKAATKAGKGKAGN